MSQETIKKSKLFVPGFGFYGKQGEAFREPAITKV